MSLRDILEFTAEVGTAYLKATHFRQLLDANREEAMGLLNRRVRSLSSEQLDAFESEFLTQAIHVIDAPGRRRAMELYAYLKICETDHYGKFRGFFR